MDPCLYGVQPCLWGEAPAAWLLYLKLCGVALPHCWLLIGIPWQQPVGSQTPPWFLSQVGFGAGLLQCASSSLSLAAAP